MNQDRTIRIFISSTFKDMHVERELLVKQVFPELRRICAERFVTFTDVDLRWGITEEQAAEGKVLPICLEEINRCRPYFLGLLGERYGWIPQSIPREVIENEPWLKEHAGHRTSVTELEILHGVLNNPQMAGHAFFYFRNPSYVQTLPEKDRNDFVSEDPQSAEKLERLKNKIRQSALPVFENYTGPEALAETVREQFKELIDKLYPKEQTPDFLDQEAAGHEAYAQSKLLAYVERTEHTAAINAFIKAQASGQGLVITGDSGGGKSALLASWTKKWQDQHPDDFVFQHYFGATPQSASVNGFLSRLLGELKRRFEISDDIPADPDKMREALPLWLAQASEKTSLSHKAGAKLILVLDALNQVEGSDPDRHLFFLPRYFQENVRVLASALPGPALDALKERSWKEQPLPLPGPDERNRMISAFMELYRKTLRSDLSNQLSAAPGAANPLFLRTVLEELRQFGSFEKLPQQVNFYLEAQTPAELFRRIVRRWQGDFDNNRNLVRHALEFLWAARKGLSENEWLELLGSNGQPLPRQVFAPLFNAMEPHLAKRSGLYTFGHDFLRQAVQNEFLQAIEEQNAAHLKLAGYFETQPGMTPRKSAEWPWQLHAAQAWEHLEHCLTDKDLFVALYNKQTQWDLTGYWHPLRLHGVSLGERYLRAFDCWVERDPVLDEDYHLLNRLASFLYENACYPEAEPLLRRALEGFERVLGKDHPDTLTSVSGLALLLSSKGDYAGAEPLYRRALEGNERVLGKDHPNTLTIVNNLAALLKSKGDYASAELLHRRALEGRERVLGKDHPNTLTSVNNLAALLDSKGDSAEAEPLYRRALEGRERVLGKDHPDTLMSLNNLAILLRSKGDYAGAEPLYRRALEGRERVLGKDHPATLTSVSGLAGLLDSKGDYAGAEPLYRRALEGNERVLGKDHPDTLMSVNDLAVLLYNKEDYNGAETAFRRALVGIISISRATGQDHPNVQTFYNNWVASLKALGLSEVEIKAKTQEIWR